MSDQPRVPAQKSPNQPAESEQPQKSGSWKSWLMGWVVVPMMFLGAIFGGGVLFGAHYTDAWWTRGVLWLAGGG